MDFTLGQKVRDAVTGLEGTATGFCTYITGCDQYLVQPRCKEGGESVESRWVDVDRLELVEGEPIVLPGAKRSSKPTPGPDKPAPIR